MAEQRERVLNYLSRSRFGNNDILFGTDWRQATPVSQLGAHPRGKVLANGDAHARVVLDKIVLAARAGGGFVEYQYSDTLASRAAGQGELRASTHSLGGG